MEEQKMAETFKLPSSSYEELIKLFQAYANTKEGTALSLDDITQATGVPRTVVSKNNGFMVQVGLITEGNGSIFLASFNCAQCSFSRKVFIIAVLNFIFCARSSPYSYKKAKEPQDVCILS